MNATRKILVVDDDPYILMSLEFLMKKNGYEVIVARNGNEALELVDKQLPHLVLLDIMMPDVDGYEICRHIKSSKKLKAIKVVFMSAKSREADIQKGYDLGASLYITKPFSTREMMKQINTLMSSDAE
jgi:DNA-binding response OmpR family regulator